MRPEFKDRAAEALWTRYFADVHRALRFVDEADARELRQDLEAHLADSFAQRDAAQPELPRLEQAISRLGRPAEYLRPLIADGLLDRGTQSFRPASLIQGLYYSVRLGSKRAMIALGFALGYALIAIFLLMAVLKPFWASNVGLFLAPGGGIEFGIMSDTAGARELLGWWTIPVAILLGAVLYGVLTRQLRAVLRRR